MAEQTYAVKLNLNQFQRRVSLLSHLDIELTGTLRQRLYPLFHQST